MSEQAPIEVPAHEIILVQDRKEQQQCYDVRIAVFHVEQKFPLETELDEHDDAPGTAHFLLRLTPSLTPIGTIRGLKFSKPDGATYYKLTRLAILKEYRKYRFGRALVTVLHDWVRADALTSLAPEQPDTGATATVVSHSQIPVKGFYAKFGYVPEGDEFDEDGDPHQKMVLRTPLRASPSPAHADP